MRATKQAAFEQLQKKFVELDKRMLHQFDEAEQVGEALNTIEKWLLDEKSGLPKDAMEGKRIHTFSKCD
jgi:hypothetical protein